MGPTNTMLPVNFSDVKDAARRLEGIVVKTPVVNSSEIDRLAGRKIFMKFLSPRLRMRE